MVLCKLERRNYGRKWSVIIKYQNLHSFKEGLIQWCQSILEKRRITHLHDSAHFRIALKDKKGTAITNVFQKILDESNHKPNRIRVDKGIKPYNRSMKSFLQNNNIEMYSKHNEGKFAVAEKFIRTLKNKICKYMT